MNEQNVSNLWVTIDHHLLCKPHFNRVWLQLGSLLWSYEGRLWPLWHSHNDNQHKYGSVWLSVTYSFNKHSLQNYTGIRIDCDIYLSLRNIYYFQTEWHPEIKPSVFPLYDPYKKRYCGGTMLQELYQRAIMGL